MAIQTVPVSLTLSPHSKGKWPAEKFLCLYYVFRMIMHLVSQTVWHPMQEILHPCTIFPRQNGIPPGNLDPLLSREILQISCRDTILPLGCQIAYDTGQNWTSRTGSSLNPRLLVGYFVSGTRREHTVL